MTNNPNPLNTGPQDEGALTGFLKWLIRLVWDEDRWLGLAVVLTMIVVVAAIIGQINGVTQQGITNLATYIGAVLAVCIVSLGIIKVFRGSIYGHILIVFVMILTMIGTVLFAAQFFSGDKIPYLTRSGCMWNPYSRGCPLSTEYSVATTELTDVEVPTLTPLSTGSTGTVATATDVEGFDNPVYVQFAGALSRERVIKVSEELVEVDWNIQGAARGGERISSAYGLNEVRYFFAEDHDAAIALAEKYNSLSDWIGADAMSVRDLSSSGFNPQQGLLEIWTSVR